MNPVLIWLSLSGSDKSIPGCVCVRSFINQSCEQALLWPKPSTINSHRWQCLTSQLKHCTYADSTILCFIDKNMKWDETLPGAANLLRWHYNNLFVSKMGLNKSWLMSTNNPYAGFNGLCRVLQMITIHIEVG